MPKAKAGTVDQYIQLAPEQGRPMLREMRALLKKIVPNAKEGLKWGAPVFEDGRILFSYSAHKDHLSFVPTGPTLQEFKEELAGYELGQDSIQFPYNKPLPKALIRKIAAFRAKQVKDEDAKWKY
jgi:uncharacterized protein YdhG (YjbR/CyaY superfamily)